MTGDVGTCPYCGALHQSDYGEAGPRAVRPWLTRAGQFPVEHIRVPDAFSGPVDWDDPPAGVLHTIEGTYSAGLGVFLQHYAPHFVVGPNRIAQLLPVGLIGLALRAHNALARVQVEVEGFSKETPWIFPDAVLAPLAALMKACEVEYGIPLFRPFPDSVYGRASAEDPHRAAGKFGHVAGWYGHGDMPAPDAHWDPGCLEWTKLFAAAAAVEYAPPAPIGLDPVTPCPGGQGQAPEPDPVAFDLETVAGVQGALRALGYPIKVDGTAGPETIDALRRFQTASLIAADGIAGTATKTALRYALERLSSLKGART
jgi:Putative peptidoglycan binding domain